MTEGRPARWRQGLVVTTLVGLIASLLAVWAGLEDLRFPWMDLPDARPSAHSAPSLAPTRVPASPRASSPRPPERTPEAPPPTRPHVPPALLSDLPTVDPGPGDDSIDLEFGDLVVRGQTYGNSLKYECSLYCDGSSPQTYKAALGGKYRRFMAVAAIADTAAHGVARVEIDVDGEHHAYQTRLGAPFKINIDVRGAIQLRIRFYAPTELKHPIQAGVDAAAGQSSTLPNLGLASPRLVS